MPRYTVRCPNRPEFGGKEFSCADELVAVYDGQNYFGSTEDVEVWLEGLKVAESISGVIKLLASPQWGQLGKH